MKWISLWFCSNFSNYRARFSMPGGTENLMYSFDLGPVHFIGFSTEVYYFMNYGIKSLIKQYEWLEKDLIEANKPENRWVLRPIVWKNHSSSQSKLLQEEASLDHNVRTSSDVLQQWERWWLHAFGNASPCRLAVHSFLRIGGSFLWVRSRCGDLGTRAFVRASLANLQLSSVERIVRASVHKSKSTGPFGDGFRWLQRGPRTICARHSGVECIPQPRLWLHAIEGPQ